MFVVVFGSIHITFLLFSITILSLFPNVILTLDFSLSTFYYFTLNSLDFIIGMAIMMPTSSS
jgi:hypothetical protein